MSGGGHLLVSGSRATSMNFPPPARSSTSDIAVAARERTQKLTAAPPTASDPALIVGPAREQQGEGVSVDAIVLPAQSRKESTGRQCPSLKSL